VNKPVRSALDILLLSAIWLGACRRRGPEAFGEAVDDSRAVPISRLPIAEASQPPRAVVVSGRIAEVCRTSGCWVLLQEVEGGKVHELLVDLKPRSDFTVPARLRGREAVVLGILVGAEPDRTLEATGMVVP